MVESPVLDGRGSADVRDRLFALAPYYLDDWHPDADDAGAALVELFAEMAGGLTERVDRAPEKHRIAFYDALGFDREPPQAATVPVRFSIDPDAPENVAIATGTELEASTDDEPEAFRIGSTAAFEATPAALTHVFSVAPDTDEIFAHHDAIDGTDAATLFDGTDIQEHAFYLGHPDRFAVSGGSTIALELQTAHDPTDLAWAYYGESEEGEEGWHEFTGDALVREGDTLLLRPDGDVVETDVDERESAWLRASVPSSVPPANRFGFELDDVEIGGTSNAAEVDGLYANDVPQPTDGSAIYPFGSIPQQRDAFYVACAEAFTKPGADVTVTFDGRDDISATDDPRLSWEYFDGQAWQLLPGVDGDAAFHGDGDSASIQFEGPSDMSRTAVSGQDGVWIRARLVAGEYVDIVFEHDDSDEPTESRRTIEGSPPSFTDVSIEYAYEAADPPTQLVTKNGLAHSANLAERDGPLRPFVAVPDAVQTAYFGFDGPLTGGPIQLYLDLADQEYPDDFAPRIRWERLDPETGTWERVHTDDETDGFTRAGIVGFSFAEETVAADRFGTSRHWVRARVRGDAFGPAADDDEGASFVEAKLVAEQDIPLEPCTPFLATEPGGIEVRPAAPGVDGVYPNTGIAANVRIVDDEVLGSSDGTPNLELSVSRPPAIEIDVWVDESVALSTEQRAALEAEHPDDIAVELGADGDVRAAWVRWSAVTSLEGADETDRVYVLNRVEGTIAFGDGTRGRIPPAGHDNVRASYRTGGGEAGNVEPGAVADLPTAIPHVEEVANPIAATGGATAESTHAVLDRAPRELRDRNRAVTAPDYERIAMEAARELATVRCLRGMNREGEREPGWVTLLVVPDERIETPVPSVRLRQAVQRRVSDAAPIHLVARDRLIVRAPTYVSTGVSATVAAEDVPSLSALESTIEDRLVAFLHPLAGNAGEGWAFGELPTVSDVIAEIEGIEGVDHVPRLVLTYDGRETITTGESPPDVSPDVLVHSGTHELVLEPHTRRCAEVD